MAAFAQLPSSKEKAAGSPARDFSQHHKLLEEFRSKLAGDLNHLESEGQLKDADETLDILMTILNHRLR